MGGMIFDFKKNTENMLRTNARSGDFFNFGGQNHVNLVDAVMRFLTSYVIRIWIKIIPYSRTHAY